MAAPDLSATIAAVWRIESARVLGSLTRLLRDVGLAEDFAQDALIAALEQWPRSGVPDNPGAWLTTTAHHRALDHLRRQRMLDRKHRLLGEAAEVAMDERTPEASVEQGAIDDDVLRLMFVACHPALPAEARSALTLRLLGGLTTAEIAHAFLVPEPTIAQRIVRAKKTLREAQVAFELPAREDLPERLGSVLEVIYLLFNEGYTATAGAQWMRPALCEEALRLGRILAELSPQQPEVHGLTALMELQASRIGARVNGAGDPILLTDQIRVRWDQLLIRRGLAALARGEALGARGPYLLQAAIAACHARAATLEQTDWTAMAALYQELFALTGSPVVELNRAVAVSMCQGPAAGLAIADRLAAQGALHSYHLLPSVRADLLEKLGRAGEARREWQHAASLTHNEREQRLLCERADRLRGEP
ncbi:MAG TPA: RNA polymerase sigma factor [Steroidobacteraceae bacterium]|jgi:RNA polymerase sigma factor (sigma-70 family)